MVLRLVLVDEPDPAGGDQGQLAGVVVQVLVLNYSRASTPIVSEEINRTHIELARLAVLLLRSDGGRRLLVAARGLARGEKRRSKPSNMHGYWELDTHVFPSVLVTVVV